MSEIYEGIAEDAFSLASAYFGALDLVEKGASIEELVRFLDSPDDDLREAACRIMNSGQNDPQLIDASPRLRLVK